MTCDVAIIGGGPAGATVGTLLKKYSPKLDVVIIERAQFPRDHVGESLLPAVPRILHEMGVWDKVEAANFPIKLGATYRWGKQSDQDLYYFHFLPGGKFTQTQRPGHYSGERARTTFQVDRSIYDKILLDHAEEMGCRVHQRSKVVEVKRMGDRIDGLTVWFDGESEPESVEARYYIDASGGESIVRKTMGVEIDSPTLLRNIAMWDYWHNAEWAEKVGVDGTYVRILSLGYGWLWFIPLGPTRTSIGFITAADYYKKSGKSTEELYLEAIATEPIVRELTQNATREDRLEATKDWSFVAERLYGENWFLAGDAGGFADPILSAGLTLAQVGARRIAYTILETERGELDPHWTRDQFDTIQRANIRNHIRFADYWYSANQQFTDLKDYCSEIAKSSGLTLDADAAFQWLGTGGFTDDFTGVPHSGTYTLTSIKAFTSRFSEDPAKWYVYENNLFELNTDGADPDTVAMFDEGRIYRVDCLRRDSKVWAMIGVYHCIFKALSAEREILPLTERFIFEMKKLGMPISPFMTRLCLEALEGLITEGWIKASYDSSLPLLDRGIKQQSA